MNSGRSSWVAAGAIALAALGFAAFTGHIWEDYFITFRASLNLAQGHGLVFQPGERVHSFTSPLGTLLPALFALGGGEDVALRALWAFRVASALALAAAVWLALAVFRADGLGRGAAGAVAAVWVCDPKTIGFSINGMETAFTILFAVLVWRALVAGGRFWPAVAGVAGLQWTRPDGAVFFIVLGLAWLALGAAQPGEPSPRRARFGWLVRVSAAALAVYLPWLVWAWIYYGSPVPHTVLAKVPHHAPGELLPALALYPWRLLVGHAAVHDLFLPAYHFFGGWPAALRWLARAAAVGAALAWLWPRVKPAGRVASLAFFLGGFYVEYIPRSPWYYPGWQALALLAWAYLGHAAATAEAGAAALQRGLRSAVRIAAATAVAVQAALLGAVAVQLRAQQRIVEDGHRREIGRWLAVQAAPRDRVFVECLGYIGYYSQLKMLDWPGLASPEVVAARKAGARTWAQVVGSLRPEWLVLRPADAVTMFGEAPGLAADYGLVRMFDVRREIETAVHGFLPGRGFLDFDAVFLVYRRGAPGAERP